MVKSEIIKVVGTYGEEGSVGTVHIDGPYDTFACGLDPLDYEVKLVKRKPVTCSTCLKFIEWAKEIALTPPPADKQRL